MSSFTCAICGHESKNIKGLTTHITMRHISDGTIESQEAYYKKYISTERGRCEFCLKPTKFFRIDLGYHRFCDKLCSVYIKHTGKHECKICNGKFSTISILEKHITIAHKIDLKSYLKEYEKKTGTCRVCDKETDYINFEHGWKETCIDHSTNMTCGLCGIILNSPRLLQFHINKHIKNGDIESVESYYLKYIGECGRCKVCNKELKFSGYINKAYSDYCSSRCVSIDTKSKFSETCMKRYGVVNPLKSTEIKKKVADTNLKRYGVECVFSDESIKAKIEKTNILKYGHKSPMSNKTIQDKFCDAMFKKYGVRYPCQNDRIKDKIKATTIKNFGVDHPTKVPAIIEKMLRTRDKNQRPKKWLKLISIFKHRRVTPKFDQSYYFDINNKDFTFTCDICNKDFTVKNVSNSMFPRCYECWPSFGSTMEQDFTAWLKSVYDGVIIIHERNIIKPKELDIYIPDKNFAIALNGDYWHTDKNLDPMYHSNKTTECLKHGINLLHIFERDYMNALDVVKSMTLSRMGLLNNRIHARKCIVQSISNKDAKDFISKNHLKGSSPNAFLSYGLYYNNELVSVLTYANPGKRLIFGGSNNPTEIELLRYCNKIYLNIPGAFSKLLKFSIKDLLINGIKSIFTYADVMYSANELDTVYHKNGFRYLGKSTPGYGYFYENKYYSRFAFTKLSLTKICLDKNIEVLSIDTEDSLATKIGAHKIRDCGQHKYNLYLQVNE